MKVRQVYNLLNEMAPFDTQLGFDNAGLLIGSADHEVSKTAIALDATVSVIHKAVALKCDLLITHHPIIFDALKRVEKDSPVYLCIEKGLNVISAHTNADAADGGVNDCLAERIGLTDVEKLSDGTQPAMVRMGDIHFNSCDEFAQHLQSALGCRVRYVDHDKAINKVAVCGGSSADSIKAAMQSGCDALVTGECKHNHRIDAQNAGFALFECGHYHTEKYIKDVFYRLLSSAGCACVIIDETDPAKYI